MWRKFHLPRIVSWPLNAQELEERARGRLELIRLPDGTLLPEPEGYVCDLVPSQLREMARAA